MICRNSIIFVVLFTISFSAQIHCSDNQLGIDLNNLNNIDIDKIQDKLKDQFPQIPGLEIPNSLKNATVNIENFKQVIKDKCAKVSGGQEAYDAIEKEAEHLQSCVTGLVDVEQLQNEIKKAEPSGELDTVFNKYCGKRNIAIACVENFTATLEPCLEQKEIEGKRTFVKIFKNLLNFVCHKEGDQIALFIAEKGPECFDSQKEELLTCMNKTFYGYLPSEKDIDTKATPTELPELVMGAEQCKDMDVLQLCVVKSLEKCEESTPANLVESMFKFVREETPCVNITSTYVKSTGKTGDANSITSTTSVLIASILAFFAMRFQAYFSVDQKLASINLIAAKS